MFIRLITLALLSFAIMGGGARAGSAPPVRRDSPDALVQLGRKLMPTPLAQLMEHRERELLQGFHQSGDTKDLEEARQRLRQTQADLIRILAGTPSFDEVVFRFGLLARRVCEMNTFRHYASDAQEAARLETFERLATAKRSRFVPVFYDYSPLLFKDPLPEQYWDQTVARNRGLSARIAQRYQDGAGAVLFDDRSPAFGLASLHFSHTITDIANAWLFCWRESNGDMDGVPFFPYPRSPRPNHGVSP